MCIVYYTTVFKNKWKVVSDLYEWNETIQKIINRTEENLEENPSLARISEHTGYSPCYCSKCFHDICGMTIKDILQEEN